MQQGRPITAENYINKLIFLKKTVLEKQRSVYCVLTVWAVCGAAVIWESKGMNPSAAPPTALSWACQAGRSPALSLPPSMAIISHTFQMMTPMGRTERLQPGKAELGFKPGLSTRPQSFSLSCGVPRMFQRWRGKWGPESNEREPQRKTLERWSLRMWSCLQL